MDDNKPQYRSFTTYGMLACGIISIALGIYMNINGIEAVGMLSRRRGIGSATGTSAILLGLIISAYPIYDLLKAKMKK